MLSLFHLVEIIGVIVLVIEGELLAGCRSYLIDIEIVDPVPIVEVITAADITSLAGLFLIIMVS